MTDKNSLINVAFIGAGKFANAFHYSTLSQMDDVRIAAIADLDQELLQRVGQKYGVTDLYADYHEMLARDDLDAVYVIMRPHLLKPIVLDVIAAGKAVFTEKPLGMDASEAQELADAAAAKGVQSCVGLNRRYCAVVRKAKELVEEQGPISSILAEFHKDLKQEMFGMSVLYADALHVLDPMRFWCGDAVEVHAHADTRYGSEGWEHSHNVYNALIRFESGASGIYSINRQAGGRYERMEVHGNKISAYIRAPETLEVWRSGQKEPEIITGESLVSSSDMLMTYGYWHENRAFIDCLKNNRPPETNFADVAKTMALCKEIENGSSADLKPAS